jgi:O-6-methylguanine DNA methyltransferase
MTQEVSPLYSCPTGPGLLMLIHVGEGRIVQTDLEVISEEGMHWQITGDKLKGSLEKNICAWIETYCKGEQPKQKLPLDLDFLPPFTLAILEHLQSLPFGKALSYQQLAARIGNPKGARAVGNACGRNPVPLFVPCHRIIASGQRLGGFGMGISLKQRLLQFEKIAFS